MSDIDETVTETDTRASLLERAKKARKGRYDRGAINEELTDMAIAFVRGEISSTQAGVALKCERQGAVQRMWTAFRRAVISGRVGVEDRWGKAKVADPDPYQQQHYNPNQHWNGGAR